MSGSQKRKKREKKGGGEGADSSNPLGINLAGAGGAHKNKGKCSNNCLLPICLHLWDPKCHISNQNTDPPYLENRVLIAYPGFHNPRKAPPETNAQLPATGLEDGVWVATTKLRAEIEKNSPQFIVHSFFPWKLQAVNRLQSSRSYIYIRQILPV